MPAADISETALEMAEVSMQQCAYVRHSAYFTASLAFARGRDLIPMVS